MNSKMSGRSINIINARGRQWWCCYLHIKPFIHHFRCAAWKPMWIVPNMCIKNTYIHICMCWPIWQEGMYSYFLICCFGIFSTSRFWNCQFSFTDIGCYTVTGRVQRVLCHLRQKQMRYEMHRKTAGYSYIHQVHSSACFSIFSRCLLMRLYLARNSWLRKAAKSQCARSAAWNSSHVKIFWGDDDGLSGIVISSSPPTSTSLIGSTSGR